MSARPSNTFHFLTQAMALQSSHLSSLTRSNRTVVEAMWIAGIIPSQGYSYGNLALRGGVLVTMEYAALWAVDVVEVVRPGTPFQCHPLTLT